MSSSTCWSSLLQTAAQCHVYHRLAGVAVNVILAAFIAPMAVKMALLVINILTNEMGLLALVMTSLFSVVAGFLAQKLSTSEKALKRWLHESSGRVPMYAFVLSCLIARPFGRPPASIISWDGSAILWTCWSSLRLALAVSSLVIAIMLRYISPISINKISAVPLLLNTVESSVRNFFLQPLSVVEPSDTPEQHAVKARVIEGRRFIRPPLRNFLLHLLVSFLAGIMSSFTVLAYIPALSDESTMVSVACGLAVAITIPTPPAHELDYQVYQSFDHVYWSRTDILDICGRAITLSLALLSTTMLLSSTPWDSQATFTLLANLLLAAVTVTALVRALESYMQSELFAVFDIAQSIDERLAEPTVFLRIHAVLLGLVYDMDIACEIQAADRMDERREYTRCMELSKSLAPLLLTPVPSGYTETPFEEDLFRMAILEAIGGDRMLPANNWLAPHVDVKDVLIRHSLVKALCVLLGGWGEALVLISSPKGGQHESPCGKVFWSLGVGFFTAADYALKGLSGFIVGNIKTDGAVRDWKGHDLAPLVPAAIQGIFWLHKGLLLFQKCHLSEIFVSSATASAAMSLIALCEVATTRILACLKLPYTNAGALPDLFTDNSECRLWIENIAKWPLPVSATRFATECS